MSFLDKIFQHLTDKDLNNNQPIPAEADIVLVGAGMASLYTAWRILSDERYKDKKIAILEMIDRTGGRLDSDIIKIDGEEVKEEEGGMRFTFNSMDNLMSLFLYLDLVDQITPFPMSSGGNNRLHFRGHSFTNQEGLKDDISIWEELYDLAPQEQGVNPKTIINTIYNRILSVNEDFLNSITPEEREDRGPEYWQKFRINCQWKNIPLYKWTLQGLMSNMGYSKECITLLYRLLGFNGTFLSEMNAGVAYQLLEEFPADPKFKTLVKGFSTLPNKLVELIGTNRIYLKTRVEGIEKTGDTYAINYSTLRSPDCSVGQSEPTEGVIKTKQVIVGLPRLAMEKLFNKSGAFKVMGLTAAESLWNTLQTATNQPLIKINLYYDRPWWSNSMTGEPPIKFGPNFSDLPLGSVYPFYTIDEEGAIALEYEKQLKDAGMPIPEEVQEVLNRKYKQPAALTIYCDYLNINFWKGLQHAGSPYHAELQARNPKLCPATDLVVEEATKFFKILFNTHYVPKPILTSARIWSGSSSFGEYHGQQLGKRNTSRLGEQVGYGVHQWGLGAKDDDVIASLVQPVAGEEIYTCGEAFSDYQGWVEGALRSANLVLEKAFDIKALYDTSTFKERFGSQDSVEELISRAYYNRYGELIQETFPQSREAATPEKVAYDNTSYEVKLSYDL